MRVLMFFGALLYALCKMFCDFWEKKANNEKLVQQQQQDQTQMQKLASIYTFYIPVIVQAINNVRSACALEPVENFSQVITKEKVRKLKPDSYCMLYRARQKLDAVTDAHELARKLQVEVDIICDLFGYDAIHIAVRYYPDEQAEIMVKLAADDIAARAKAITI